MSGKSMFHYNLTIIMGTLYEDEYTFKIISPPVLLRMRKFSDKSCRVNQGINFMLNNFLFSKTMPFMRLCGKNIVGSDRPQMTILRKCIAC
jgi:hypothetical protein